MNGVFVIDRVRALMDHAETHRQRTGRPFVTLTYAQSVDGCIAARRGERLVISGPKSAVLTHQLRALHDAILVGVGTVVDDDPRLTVRLVAGPDPQVVVVDSRLRAPTSANIFANPRPPWFATTAAADTHRFLDEAGAGVQTMVLPSTDNGWVDLGAMLQSLAEIGIRSLMVEGGSRIITSFLSAQLVDHVLITTAPIFLGGLRSVEHPVGIRGAIPRLLNPSFHPIGDDFIIAGDLSTSLD